MSNYSIASAGRARTKAAGLANRLRWLLHVARRPALARGGPALIVGSGAVITLTGAGSIGRGVGVVALRDLTLAVQGRLTFGDHVFMARGVHITCFDAVSIGSDVRFGERVSIHDENHVIEPLSASSARASGYVVSPVSIGDRVWLGANVVVLSGVSIGDDTVVAANSVVASSLPPGVLAAGAPAQVKRALRETID